jgi:hypothetical protein
VSRRTLPIAFIYLLAALPNVLGEFLAARSRHNSGGAAKDGVAFGLVNGPWASNVVGSPRQPIGRQSFEFLENGF